MAEVRANASRGMGAVVTLGLAVAGWAGQASSGRAEIEAFNKRYIDAHLRMDTPMILSFWAEDGVSLLPEMAPLLGRPAIAKFVEDVVAKMPGYKVTKQEIDFRDIQVSDDWASEWGMERQVVQPPDGKALIDSRGKILLVLHKNTKGEWKVQQEMWNSAPKE
jgi:uncharacterized protein (TIGR02246 family)